MSDPAEDRRRTILPALALGLTTMAFIMAKTGRDALFFQGGGGLLQLPVIYINIGAASLPLALLFVKAMKIWGARRARLGVFALAASVMGLASPFLQPGGNTPMLAMFMFIPAIFGLLFASLWLLASEIFEKADKGHAARAFSKIGAATLAGGMAGGLLAKGLAPHLDPKWLIAAGAAATVGVIFLVLGIHRRLAGISAAARAQGGKPALLAPVKNKYALTLVLISMSGALAGLLIDFQFYAAAAGAGMGAKGSANFFANFYILLNFSSLLLQLFVTPRIQDTIGLRGGLMVLPFALVGGASFAGAAATAFSLSVLRVTEGGLRSSVHRSIWEQAFIPVDPAERSTVKIAVDGIAARVAEIAGALAILFWLRFPQESFVEPLDTRWMAWATLATVGFWLGITQRLQVQARRATTPPCETAETEIECARFPDQCPCTTELGKGIA